MKKLWLACAIVLTMGISSCVDSEKDLRQEVPEEEINTSNFTTERTVQVEINYTNPNSRVPFFIYDKDPLRIGENTISLDESIKPLDAAWTDDQGKFSGEMELPAYVSDIYIVSTSPFVTLSMKGKVTNGILKVSDTDEQPVSRASRYSRPTTYEENRFEKLGWKNSLGYFDPKTGDVQYVYKGLDPKLTLSTSEMKELSTTINKVLNTYGSCPQEYRTAADLYVNDNNTAVVLTALSGWTCWNSSLGYYYYRKDQPIKSLSEVDIYTVFPNTQMTWNNGNYESNPRGVKAGTAVQLKYFDAEHPEGTNFPAGYNIGFVLACNAWSTYFTGFDSYKDTINYFSCSTKGLSNKGANGVDVHTAMFKDSNKNISNAFEDFKDDDNFTDVIFALKANPEITNVPDVDKDLNTTVEKSGIYAFEDLWPKAGDYDMNDVLVQYTYQKTFNVYNEILKEAFIFKPLVNTSQAVYNNGLAFRMKDAGSVVTEDAVKSNSSEEFTPATLKHESGNVILLTEGVKTNPTAQYKVSVNYQKGQKLKETAIDAFIYRPSTDNTRLEVHCPMERPTDQVNISLFGQEDDRSEPDKGIYYVSDKNNVYPFAFYLSNATEKDIAPLLDPNNEKTPISDLYPKFIDWAKNNGTNADWYKK